MTEPDKNEIEINDTFVRPYTLTGGRTDVEGVPVAIEAIVSRRVPARGLPDVGPVEAAIYDLAAEQLSTAEISARLGLPVGVIRVLIADLVGAGHLRLGRRAEPGDITIVKRLINGIRSL